MHLYGYFDRIIYVRFLTTNQIKQGLKSKRTCCGLSKVVCGGLSPALTTYFGPTGKVEDNHILENWLLDNQVNLLKNKVITYS